MLDHSGGAATVTPTTTTDSGVAFQEAGRPGGAGSPPGVAKQKRKPWDLCRCCGRKHPQAKDPQKCKNVSQARKDEVAAEMAREEAEKNSPSRPPPATRPTQQRGTTHTHVQEQDEASVSEATGGGNESSHGSFDVSSGVRFRGPPTSPFFGLFRSFGDEFRTNLCPRTSVARKRT